ncbi:MAG: LptF/LptG family permease [bacterium]
MIYGMRILPAYIRNSFAVTFLMTLLMVTFVICVMALFRLSDLLAGGGSGTLIFKIFAYSMPEAFSFSIPISLMTAALLTFGKFSANGEITAMKACGISMWQIARPPLMIATLMSMVCLILNADLNPNAKLAQRNALRRLGMENPLQLLEEGRFIRDFPGYTFYLGAKQRNAFTDVIIYQYGDNGKVRNIRARRGIVGASTDKTQLKIDLYDVRVDPLSDEIQGPGFFDHYPMTVDVSTLLKDSKRSKRRSDMTMVELVNAADDPRAVYPEVTPDKVAEQSSVFLVEINKRLVLAISCLSFVLLGIPLGTTTHRRESSIGIGLSLMLVFVFFMFTIIGESMAKHAALLPWLIPWVPVIASILIGVVLFRRRN